MGAKPGLLQHGAEDDHQEWREGLCSGKVSNLPLKLFFSTELVQWKRNQFNLGEMLHTPIATSQFWTTSSSLRFSVVQTEAWLKNLSSGGGKSFHYEQSLRRWLDLRVRHGLVSLWHPVLWDDLSGGWFLFTTVNLTLLAQTEGNSGEFVKLVVSGLEYIGPRDLTQYFIRNTNITLKADNEVEVMVVLGRFFTRGNFSPDTFPRQEAAGNHPDLLHTNLPAHPHQLLLQLLQALLLCNDINVNINQSYESQTRKRRLWSTWPWCWCWSRCSSLCLRASPRPPTSRWSTSGSSLPS